MGDSLLSKVSREETEGEDHPYGRPHLPTCPTMKKLEEDS